MNSFAPRAIASIAPFALLAILPRCSASLDVPGEALIACTSDTMCPPDWLCNQGVCAQVTNNFAPQVSVGTIGAPAGGRFLYWVDVPFTVADSEGSPYGNDRVTLLPEYTVVESPDELAAAQWFVATAAQNSDAMVNIAAVAAGAEQLFVWDALADAKLGRSQLNWHLALAQTVGTAGEPQPVDQLIAHPWVALRLTSTDSAGNKGAVAQSALFALGNQAPTATLQAIAGQHSGAVPISFSLRDTSADLVRVQLEFSTDAGTTWRPAKVLLGSLTDLAALPAGSTHVVVWDSVAAQAADATTADQGIGPTWLSDVQVRVRGMDSPALDTLNYGEWDVATGVEIRNQDPPRIEAAVAERTLRASGPGPVDIHYTLFDPQADLVDVEFEYSLDNGVTWVAALEYPAEGREGRYELQSGVATRPAIRHLFVWDAAGLIGAAQPTTRVRMRAADSFVGPGPYADVIIGRSPTPQGDYLQSFLLVHDAQFQAAGELAIGDVDGNGFDDIVYYFQDSGGFVVLLNIAGQLVVQPPHLSNLIHDIKLLHVNSDDFLDLITLHDNQNQLTVWLGSGDGTFSEDASYATQANTHRLAVGYFDSDPFIDVAVGGGGPAGSDFGVLLGNGDGTFGAATFMDGNGSSTLYNPTLIRALDANGDGIYDWVLTGGGVHVNINNGSGGVASRTSYAVNVSNLPQPADLDADGYLDVLVLSESQATLLRNAGDGTGDFIAMPAPSFVKGSAAGLGATDHNGDGILDLVVASSSALYLAYGITDAGGKPTLTYSLPAAIPYTPGSIRGFGIADFNGDGTPDFVVGQYARGLRLIQSPEARVDTLVQRGETHERVGLGSSGVAIVDVNDDGAPDVLTGGSNQAYLFLGHAAFPGRGDGSLVGGLVGPQAAVGALAACDVTGDGVDDLVVNSATAVELWLGGSQVSGAGDGSFAWLADLATCSAQVIRCVDLNKDGLLDLALACGTDGLTTLIANSDASGGWAGTFAVQNTPTTRSATDIAPYDFNHDGHVDLIVAAYSLSEPQGLIQVFTGDGTGTFVSNVSIVAAYRAHGVVADDFNADGVTDLVTSSHQEGLETLLGGNLNGVWDGTFARTHLSCDVNYGTMYVAAVDLDGDGLRDLYSSSVEDQVGCIYLARRQAGLGDGTFVGPLTAPHGFSARAFAMADLNGDERQDIMAIGSSSGLHTFFGGAGENRPWSRAVVAAAAADTPSSLVLGPVPALDRFGQQKLYRYGLAIETDSSRLAAAPASPGSPLTRAYRVSGDTLFRARNMASPGTLTTLRYQVVHPWEGVLVFDLPIAPDRVLGGAQTIVLTRRSVSYARASDFLDDTLAGQSSAFLPCVMDDAGQCTQTIIRTTVDDAVLSLDANGDFNDGVGDRFYLVDPGPPSERKLRVLTSRGGTFQAYVLLGL